MASPYQVLLIADHKWRDLPGMVAIKVHLEDEFGIESHIAAPGCFDAAVAELNPHMVVMNTINGAYHRYMATTVKQMGGVVGVIPTEGRPQDSELMKYITGQFSVPSLVDLWLNWSETVNAVMVEGGLLPAKKARVTGSPRFDFYVRPLRSLLTSRSNFLDQYGLDPDRPTVSWATNFILARHVRTKTEGFLIRNFQDLGIANLQSFRDPVSLARRDLELRLRTMDTLFRLCMRFPAVNFLLKPHPFEETVDYQALIARCRSAGLGNIALVTEQYIWDVLNAADVHVHRLCTTGIEAWLMDVPSVNYHCESYGGWDLTNDGPAKEALAGDDLVTNEVDLTVALDHYLCGGQVSPEKKAAQETYIARWFYRLDGLSSWRCAKEIREALLTARPSAVFRMRNHNAKGITKIFLNRLTRRSYDSPARPRKLEKSVPVDYLGQRDKVVRRRDVETWTHRVREVLHASKVPP